MNSSRKVKISITLLSVNLRTASYALPHSRVLSQSHQIMWHSLLLTYKKRTIKQKTKMT